MSDIIVYNKMFPIQTYFDNAGIAGQILAPMNEPIQAKEEKPRSRGCFMGLTPNSQTPVAIRPVRQRENFGRTTPVSILTPGQYVKVEVMDGFVWGLPTGWLGGGQASLVIADDPSVFVGWSTQKVEVLIHRVRLQIQGDAAPASLTFTKAWPTRFPWPSSLPSIPVEVTRALMRLRVNNLAGASDMRILFKAQDELDIGSDGLTPGTTDITYTDVTWPPAAASVLAVAFPILDVALPRLGGDVATVALVDLTLPGGNGVLKDSYVDIARYGRI